ncbi:HPP family-domain-containing protein [Sphaerosporella brunnea]|uniref:HPP family-domain-containing protein n=1 Tax=Sphaerosporella brunnea TaxID=1250544 RepID=A0A5J5F137_9PEZI|nr:HPP family-domain-containing protein [Sphaerosporella brunnea]
MATVSAAQLLYPELQPPATGEDSQRITAPYRAPSIPTSSSSTTASTPTPLKQLPQPQLKESRLPRFLSHFAGFRPPKKQQPDKTPPPPHAVAFSLLYNSVGAFLTILGVAGVTHLISGEASVVGSIGAATVLLFLCTSSPLAQPRNMILSQLLASVIGVALSKLFIAQFHYIAIAISVAVTMLLMVLTNNVYPPAGATAVLAVLNGDWIFVGVVMASTGVLIAMGCFWVNLGELVGSLHFEERWPRWWFYEEVREATGGDVVVRIGKDGTDVIGIELTVEERRVLESISRKVQGWEDETEKKMGV